MTIVGKILVFVNLVFSLVVGGMVMLVFMTRTNWEEGFKKKSDQLTAVNLDREQTVREYETATKDYKDDLAKLKNERDDAIKARDVSRRTLAAKELELAAIQAKEREGNAAVTPIQESIKARREQVTGLEKSIETLRDEKLVLIKEKNLERAARIQADVNDKSSRARALDLENQMRELARELGRSKNPAGTVVSRKKGEENPPLDNIEGRVVTVDPDGELVKLNIGSDNGLTVGHTLKVFRLHLIPDQSKYLGIIEIVNVGPHEAVGRPLRPMSAAMRPGDRAAARLVVGN